MNNEKKYLIVASIILLVLVLGVLILQGMLRRPGTPSGSAPTPTLVPYKFQDRRPSPMIGKDGRILPSLPPEEIKKLEQFEKLKKKLPIETDDYKVEYSPNLDKIVVTRKNENADQIFDDWLMDEGYSDLVENPSTTIYSDKSMEEVQTPYSTPSAGERLQRVFNIFNIFIKQPDLSPTVLPKSSSSSSSSSQKSSSSSPQTSKPTEQGNYVYYSQCHGPYDNYPLTPTCTVCRAGCGPTTVAMILSSYVDKKYDPPEVVDIYKSIGAAACGTGLGYAKSVLNNHGVKTSDYIIPYTGAEHDIKDVRDDLKAYLDNGWTIFVLAWFKPNHGGGHYFWMTDIDDKGNALAYDPYYGMDQKPPINENIRYPMPKYAAAFGVKPK